MKLYEIIDELIMLEENWVDIETGEINETLEKRLDEVKIELDEKLENIWKVLKNYESQSTAIKNEIDKLNKRKKTIDNNFENLKRYASQALVPGKKWTSQSGLASYSWRKSTKCNIFDENKIDKDYYEIIKKINVASIKAAIKSGKEIDGAELIENQNLVIK